jgi:sialate O-acetylesterase
MVEPLLPLAARGVIWYQGESNASRARQYRTLFPLMIRAWRDALGREDLAFHFVQLASFRPARPEPGESAWAELREAQLLTLRALPRTGMAVTIDVGNANDVHPRDKQTVGRRLARWALATDHGREIEPSGPLYLAHERRGREIVLRFDHVGEGLVARQEGLPGFAIAGADRKFVWGRARIEGDTVVVSHPDVPEPVAVRYAWADNPPASLANRAGLPASPFRTDDWPGTTR